jgi:hypothetical protein
MSSSNKRVYLCNGGPWDGYRLLFSPVMDGLALTLIIKVQGIRGSYMAISKTTATWRDADHGSVSHSI